MAVRFSSLSNVAESGDANSGWIYTRTGAGDFTTTYAGGSDSSIWAGKDGGFIAVHATGIPNSGLDINNTANASNNWKVGCYANALGSPYFFVIDGVFDTAADVSFNSALGDWIWHRRLGSAYLAYASNNLGASWTLIKTITGWPTSQIWPKLNFNGAASIGPVWQLASDGVRLPAVRLVASANRLAPPFWPPSEVVRALTQPAYVAPVVQADGARERRAPGQLQRGLPPFWPPSETKRATDAPAYVAPVVQADGLRSVKAPAQFNRAVPPFWPPSEMPRTTSAPAYVAPALAGEGMRLSRKPLQFNRTVPPFWPPSEVPRASTAPASGPAPSVLISRPRFEVRRDRRRAR